MEALVNRDRNFWLRTTKHDKMHSRRVQPDILDVYNYKLPEPAVLSRQINLYVS